MKRCIGKSNMKKEVGVILISWPKDKTQLWHRQQRPEGSEA
jgi:hypothetical protein